MKQKKPNAASVYYFIERSIESCKNEEHLEKCSVLIDSAIFYNYAFVPELRHKELWQRVLLIAQRYPVFE
jgi:hypothetical protein